MARVSAWPRTWLRLDAHFYTDPRIAELPPQAELLYLRGLAYCKAHDTDGAITASSLRSISVRLRAPSTLATVLVTFGLWEATGNGWCVPRERWARWQTARPGQTDEASRARTRDARPRDHARARNQTRPDQIDTSLKVPPSNGAGRGKRQSA